MLLISIHRTDKMSVPFQWAGEANSSLSLLIKSSLNDKIEQKLQKTILNYYPCMSDHNYPTYHRWWWRRRCHQLSFSLSFNFFANGDEYLVCLGCLIFVRWVVRVMVIIKEMRSFGIWLEWWWVVGVMLISNICRWFMLKVSKWWNL